MRHLLAATFLTPAALAALPHGAHADTVVDGPRAAPVRTSAGGDVRITDDGKLKPASGPAVTIDSNNSVRNEGSIQVTGANNSGGILAEPGVRGTINNSGTIVIDEDYTPKDEDKDGDVDGPFAQGSNRFGIRVGDGFRGNIVNRGRISIEGNQSAGIAVGGTLRGSLTAGGIVTVVGDQGYGVRAGDVTGDVTISGTVDVQGRDSVAVALDGDIGGALVIQGAIGATGYRPVPASADPKKLDADDLLQGGPAVRIGGSVAGGILFDARPAERDEDDKDEDDDGVEDVREGAGTVLSRGAAPAVLIGSSDDIAIGAVAGEAAGGHGLVLNGAIAGQGTYKGVDATGLSIGGLGGKVEIAGGISVNGTVAAQSDGANATAIRIGAGTDADTLRITGKIGALGGGAGTSQVNGILIEQGAEIGTIRNSGLVRAELNGKNGNVGGIVDRSGSVNMIVNSGSIVTAGAPTPERAIAIDLRRNGGGAMVRQIAGADSDEAPAIRGDIHFGSGDDRLDIQAGSVTGDTSFRGGSNRLTMSGDSAYSGNVAFGGGNDLVALDGASQLSGSLDFGGGGGSMSLGGTSMFSGALAGTGGLAVAIDGGSLNLSNQADVELASLSVAGGGGITVNIDAASGAHTLYDVAGAASFAEGSKLNLALDSVAGSEGEYVIVRAGSLTGGANLSGNDAVLPVFFASEVTADDAAGEVTLEIRRREAGELGLNRSQASAYNAVLDNLDNDEEVADLFLNIRDRDAFEATLAQLLPEHAGGTFETVTQASRATARFLADPRSPIVDMGGWGFFLQQVAWGSSKSVGDTASYDVDGWGVAGGAELPVAGVGNFGISLAYLLGKDADGGNDNEVRTNQYELAGYWRNRWDALQAWARVSAAYVDFEGTRRFSGVSGATTISREAQGDWQGTLFSGAAGLSYEFSFGGVVVRPSASIDYYKLEEDGYTETGGGRALDLSVDDRSGDEFGANGSLTLGYDFLGGRKSESFFRAEVEGGRRELIGGSLGDTVARFEGGQDFTLLGTERSSGWVGKFRLLGGNQDFQMGGEFNAEEQQNRAALAFRATLQVGF